MISLCLHLGGLVSALSSLPHSVALTASDVRNGTICIGVETAGSDFGDMSGTGGETNIVVMNDAIVPIPISASQMSRRSSTAFRWVSQTNMHVRFLFVVNHLWIATYTRSR